MNRFSDRLGITTPARLHAEEMSDHLRAALWNMLLGPLFSDASGEGRWRQRMDRVYRYLHWRLNDLTHTSAYETEKLEKWFFSIERRWFEIYNLIDHLAKILEEHFQITKLFNGALEEEGAPYRFVGADLTPISDPIEIAAVEAALSAGDRFGGARAHIVRALQLLGQRPQPDYRNTIKEAISAVESTLKVLTGKAHADLATALSDFATKYPMHGALVSGLDKLYGYTSNEHGLRHALLEAAAKVDYAEAKFMVVACAAFMNYLITRTAS